MRTKWFLIVTLIGPLLILAMMVIPALLATRGGKGAKIAIVDDSGVLEPALRDFASLRLRLRRDDRTRPGPPTSI